MTTLILLTAPDCHLCAHGREVLDGLASQGQLRWREVNADCPEGKQLAMSAPPFRPVLFDAERGVIAYGRISSGRLERELRRELATVGTALDADRGRR